MSLESYLKVESCPNIEMVFRILENININHSVALRQAQRPSIRFSFTVEDPESARFPSAGSGLFSNLKGSETLSLSKSRDAGN